MRFQFKKKKTRGYVLSYYNYTDFEEHTENVLFYYFMSAYYMLCKHLKNIIKF